jgi:outer membrane protein OmpA-like peptidoglycan-associated protein
MNTLKIRAPMTALLSLLLGACSSPPKPPTVDETQKRPANAQMAVELQVCKNDLQNTRILATESGRLAETTAATLAHLAARQQLMAKLRERAVANSVHTVHFAFNSTRVGISADVAAPLLAEAKAAPLVLLRGRTDGSSDSPAESHIAQARASAVRDYLIASGVEPSRIRTTHQPSGDHVADNRSTQGRNLNRRVEIEVYRALPNVQQSSPPSQP